jgi:hypothetical protein
MNPICVSAFSHAGLHTVLTEGSEKMKKTMSNLAKMVKVKQNKIRFIIPILEY